MLIPEVTFRQDQGPNGRVVISYSYEGQYGQGKIRISCNANRVCIIEGEVIRGELIRALDHTCCRTIAYYPSEEKSRPLSAEKYKVITAIYCTLAILAAVIDVGNGFNVVERFSRYIDASTYSCQPDLVGDFARYLQQGICYHLMPGLKPGVSTVVFGK